MMLSHLKRLRLPLLALVLTLMFSAFGNSASAQDACIPDCANDTWGDLQPYTMYPDPVNFPYCQVTVYFRTRFACNTYYDVYIDRVESANLLSCTSNPSNPLSFGAILAKITEKLFLFKITIRTVGREPHWIVY